MTTRIARITVSVLVCALSAVVLSLGILRAGQNSQSQRQSDIAGQTITRLSDGTWLVVGGVGPIGTSDSIVIVKSANTGAPEARIAATLKDARGWHAATVLADGRVLLTGGLGAQG